MGCCAPELCVASDARVQHSAWSLFASDTVTPTPQAASKQAARVTKKTRKHNINPYQNTKHIQTPPTVPQCSHTTQRLLARIISSTCAENYAQYDIVFYFRQGRAAQPRIWHRYS